MILHARIYEPTATAIKKKAEQNRRPVSTEVQIAVENHVKKPAKRKK